MRDSFVDWETIRLAEAAGWWFRFSPDDAARCWVSPTGEEIRDFDELQKLVNPRKETNEKNQEAR